MLCRNVSKMLFSRLKFLIRMFTADYAELNELMYSNHLVVFDVWWILKKSELLFADCIDIVLSILHGLLSIPSRDLVSCKSLALSAPTQGVVMLTIRMTVPWMMSARGVVRAGPPLALAVFSQDGGNTSPISHTFPPTDFDSSPQQGESHDLFYEICFVF